jgi:hypothetical protein
VSVLNGIAKCSTWNKTPIFGNSFLSDFFTVCYIGGIVMVKCISYNPRFEECNKCLHRLSHEPTADCCEKVSCVIATSRLLKGWCKTYKPPVVRPAIPRRVYMPSPKF